MRVLVTGVCGFAGCALSESLLESCEDLTIVGIDNLIRPGSELNRTRLRKLGIQFIHADVRAASDIQGLPAADWVIDAAANPSVLAGLGSCSSRQLFEHNLGSLVNVLEYCKLHAAGLILLSSSRVYSVRALASLSLKVENRAFQLNDDQPFPPGVSLGGLTSEFTTEAPISLYGSTKLASEIVALEYGSAFDFPVWVDRCGVLAGGGQFGTPDQGIYSYWINAHLRRRPLRYIGYHGTGHQVRDVFHPRDLARLLHRQMYAKRRGGRRVYTAGGGPANAMSLAQLSTWCDQRFGPHAIGADERPRTYDVPWVVMDNSNACCDFAWRPTMEYGAILEEIAKHAERHPEWLELSGA